MNPIALIGAALLVIGLLLTRRTDARTRAGQLLAGLSPISPTEALKLAALRGDSAPYLAIKGSIDAPEIFEDEHHRPLVFRRERVSIADEGGWRVIDTDAGRGASPNCTPPGANISAQRQRRSLPHSQRVTRHAERG
jgi:hypothetical protein